MKLTKHLTATAELKSGEAEGSLSAVFSTFGVVDLDGDVLVRSAFTDGQAVPMVWSHDWAKPIGKGTIRTDPARAIFDGQFFLDTVAGADAYRTVKAMGSLQEFSWGFRILDAEPGQKDGQAIRTIKKAEVFEVSPVLVGANRETYTLAIKGRRRLSRGQLEAVITTLQALIGDDDDDEADGVVDALPAADLSIAEQGAALAALASAFRGRLTLAAPDELAELSAVAGMLALRLDDARTALALALKRAHPETETDPRYLLARFKAWETRYGDVVRGRGDQHAIAR